MTYLFYSKKTPRNKVIKYNKNFRQLDEIVKEYQLHRHLSRKLLIECRELELFANNWPASSTCS